MFEQQGQVAECGLDPLGLALEEPESLRVIVDDVDGPNQWHEFPNMSSPDLFLRHGDARVCPRLL